MSAFFAGLFVVAALTALGGWLLPRPAAAPRSRWEGFALAYLVGAAAVTVIGTAVLALGLPFLVVAGAVLLFGLLALLASFLQLSFLRDRPAVPRPRKEVAWLLTALGGLSVLASVALPINEFDPMLHFAYRGKVLTEVGTPLHESITGLLDEQGRPEQFGPLVTHPNYPFGVPVLEALVATLGGGWHERWVQLPLALWALCLPAAVWFGLRPAGRGRAQAGALLAACTPILYTRNFTEKGWRDFAEAGLGNEFTLGAGADLPVAAMLAGACALLLHARLLPRATRGTRLRLGALAGLCLAGAAMMKNEGLALVGCMLLALGLAGAWLARSRRAPEPPAVPGEAPAAATGATEAAAPHAGTRSAVLLAAGVAVLGVLPWLALRAQLPAIDENYGEQFTVERIGHFLGGGAELVERSPKALVGQADEELANPPARIALLPRYFLDEFLDLRSWGLLWLALLAALPWTWRELRDPDRRWLAMLALGGVAMYFLVLLVTPWYLPLLREKGIPERLLLHLLGPICLLAGWRLGRTDRDPETRVRDARSTLPE